MVTIPKKGKDPKIPKNRRPISLISCLRKVYERILLNRLNSQVNTNNLIPYEQFSFMPGRSTTNQQLSFAENITSGLELKYSIVAAFLDISKAYDSTWHTGLIYKLTQMNLSGELIRVIDSFLAQRSFRVKINNAVSGWRTMLARVPQGSAESPMLYNLYTSDIPGSVKLSSKLLVDVFFHFCFLSSVTSSYFCGTRPIIFVQSN